MRPLVFFILGILVIAMGFLIYNGSMSTDCEALYSEYEATVDMSQRDALFDHGMEIGCFHYN